MMKPKSSVIDFKLGSKHMSEHSIWTQTKEYLNIQKLILPKEARAVKIKLNSID